MEIFANNLINSTCHQGKYFKREVTTLFFFFFNSVKSERRESAF